MGNDHKHSDNPELGGVSSQGIDSKVKRRLIYAIILTSIILIVEVVGGLFTGSLALLSDAVHVFMDVFALSLSLFAMHISKQPPNETRTYGLHRAEVFAAFTNGSLVLLMAGFIFYHAYERLINPVEVHSLGLLIVATVGLIVNLIVALWLIKYAKSDLNIKSAFLHVAGDAVASFGVIVGAVVMHYTGYYVVDPIISLAIGGILVFGAIRIMRESGHILLEGVPKEIDLKVVCSDIKEIAGVTGVHSLHIWGICHNIYSLSAHIEVEDGKQDVHSLITGSINKVLATKHHIYYTTLQFDCTTCDSSNLFTDFKHRQHSEHLH